MALCYRCRCTCRAESIPDTDHASSSYASIGLHWDFTSMNLYGWTGKKHFSLLSIGLNTLGLHVNESLRVDGEETFLLFSKSAYKSGGRIRDLRRDRWHRLTTTAGPCQQTSEQDTSHSRYLNGYRVEERLQCLR